jgi:Fur family zinc uptake transcriptional regulator
MENSTALTGNRALIYRLFREQKGALSAYDVLEKLKNEGIKSPPVVYRALKFLESQGLIHRVESQNAYIACHHGHTHALGILMVCTSCGLVEEGGDPSLGDRLKTLTSQHHFTPTSTPLEIKGNCASCSNKHA